MKTSRVAGALGCLAVSVLLAPPTSAAQTAPAEASETTGPLAGHSLHGEAFNEGPRQAARLIGGTGRVRLAVTTAAAEAQAFFDQGVGQLHGFWYFEAERSFRQVADLDAECAMAYWGMAMANINNAARARKFIREAVSRKGSASPRERLWIDALAAYYADDKKKDTDKRREYVRALENIIQQYPDEVEAKAFLAVLVWQNSSKGLPISSHQTVDALIQQVLAVEPLHPVHHYRIHLWDSEKAARALNSAALCGPAAPEIAHMWHMPGHIYSKLRRYGDAVWQQEASSRVDHRQMAANQVIPDQIHNYAHNEEWMIRNLIFLGRVHDAIDRAKTLIEHPRHPKLNALTKSGSAQYGRARLIQTHERYEMWPELVELTGGPYLEPTSDPKEQVKRLRALGIAQFGLRRAEAGRDVMAQLEKRLAEEKHKQDEAGAAAERKAREAAKGKDDKATRDQIAKARDTARNAHKAMIDQLATTLDELHGHELAADGKHAEAAEKLAKVKGISQDLLSRLYLQAGNNAKAEEFARKAVAAGRNEVVPLANLVYVLDATGKRDEAARQFAQLRMIAAHADMETPPLERLAPLAKALGLPSDWHVAVAPLEDIGERPDLNSLGPRRWQPWAAPQWSLPDAKGQTISLADYRGGPVVVIFYLGFGCVHCVEQLKAFGPQTDDFAAAGIKLVAISTDDVEALSQSVASANEEGEFPFPLVSDASLDVFKQYRAFDDFEGRPLHATMLIDADGRVRWVDVGHEPFTDAAFLLSESQRLLKFGSRAEDNIPACKP